MATMEQELMERGRKQGMRIATVQLARCLLALHDVVTVSELTGLSLEEVQKLADER